MNSQSNVIVTRTTDGKPSLGSWLGSAIGFTVGWFLMNSLPGKTKVQMLGGALAGLVVGLVPYHVAKRNGRPTLASHALIWTSIAGILFGLLLAAPVALGFVLLAMRQPSEDR
jgi:ABC-type tungstate transport system substrate-binding protein